VRGIRLLGERVLPALASLRAPSSP
jgi:hypothetical protein